VAFSQLAAEGQTIRPNLSRNEVAGCSELRADAGKRAFTIAPNRVCSSATVESQPKTNSSTSLIFSVPMNQQIYLTQYGLMAERHWREFRPEMVRELEMKGTLMEALFEAQEQTIEEMETLTRQMEVKMDLTPQQAETAAWEMIREKYILLPAEESLSV
jgi:hypothetical protein